MAYHIAVIASESNENGMEKTILSRSDFSIHFLHTYKEAIAFAHTHISAWVVEEIPDNIPLETLLWHLNQACEQTNTPIIAISNQNKWENFLPIIKAVIPLPINIDLFNRAILQVLNLPLRRSPRYLLRLEVSFKTDVKDFLCSTVNISRYGMLIEATTTLPIGENLKFTFVGRKEWKNTALSAKILREVQGTTPSTLHHYAIEFNQISNDAVAIISSILETEYLPGGRK